MSPTVEVYIFYVSVCSIYVSLRYCVSVEKNDADVKVKSLAVDLTAYIAKPQG